MEEWSVCRLCLQSSERFLKPFPEGSYNMIPYLNIYFELVGITLSDYPTFPALICSSCERDMVQAYKFREKCIETEDKLRNMLDEQRGEIEKIEFIAEAKQNFKLEENPITPEDDKKTSDFRKTLQQCTKKYVNFERRFSAEKRKKLKNKTIQCKRCNGLYVGLDSFKIHNCFEEISKPETPVIETPPKKPPKKQYPRKTKIYKCNICSETFTYISKFNLHKDKHKNVQRYGCEYCEKRFSAWIAKRTHIYRKHLKKPFCSCADCGRGFYTKYALMVHIQKVHLNSRYQCEQCGKTMLTKKGFNDHKQTHSSEKLTCDICGKELKTKVTLSQHIKSHSGEKNYICPVCSRGFTCNFSLKTHVRKLHPDDVHLLPPDGTITNQKYLKRLAENSD